MDTINQRIIDALRARLQSITTANGYNFDLGNKVYEWRVANVHQSDLPVLVYRDVSCDTDTVEMGERHTLRVEIGLQASSANITVASLRKMIADVRRAIGIDPQWGGLAINTYYRGHVIDIDQAERVIGGATLRIDIVYRTKEWDDYTQL
jgi:hypothetical protein